MSTGDEIRADEPAAPETTEVHLDYAGVSALVTGEETARLALAGNLRRDPVRLEETLGGWLDPEAP